MYVLTKPLSFLRSREQALEFLSGGLFFHLISNRSILFSISSFMYLFMTLRVETKSNFPLWKRFSFLRLQRVRLPDLPHSFRRHPRGAPLLFPFIANHSPMRLLFRLPVLANIMVKGKGDLA